MGDRVSVNSQSGEGRRHDLSLSIPDTCVDEVFTHSKVFSQKGKNKKKKERHEIFLLEARSGERTHDLGIIQERQGDLGDPFCRQALQRALWTGFLVNLCI